MRNKQEIYKRIENILDQGYVIFSDPDVFNLDDELDEPIDLERVNSFLDWLDVMDSRN
tara:strand:- start:52 stop:225 length:174 start_codon:yes stop_codon:yes gene_type:complete